MLNQFAVEVPTLPVDQCQGSMTGSQMAKLGNFEGTMKTVCPDL